jgi:hypothetical protein
MFKAIGNMIKWIGQHFMGMLFLLIVFVVLMPSSSTQLNPANLQEIKLSGPIMTADAILKEIEEAQKDTKITKPSWKEKDKLESFIDQLGTKGIMQLQSYFYGLKASL